MFSPKRCAERLSDSGVNKARLSAANTLALSFLAGAFIALAGFAAAMASVNTPVQKLINACVFPSGLIMTAFTGSELFTGNCLMVMPLVERRITLARLLRNWVLVYIGNFIGGLFITAIGYYGGICVAGAPVGDLMIATATTKCSLPFFPALLRGIGCNILVAGGVALAADADSAASKAIAMFVPVMVFVAIGFEHCIANMFYIPAGLFAAAGSAADPALCWSNFLIGNLIPVTIGNIIGGGLLGLFLWFAHLRGREVPAG